MSHKLIDIFALILIAILVVMIVIAVRLFFI